MVFIVTAGCAGVNTCFEVFLSFDSNGGVGHCLCGCSGGSCWCCFSC